MNRKERDETLSEVKGVADMTSATWRKFEALTTCYFRLHRTPWFKEAKAWKYLEKVTGQTITDEQWSAIKSGASIVGHKSK